MGKIEIINLFKQVGDEIIIRNMNLSLESGEFIGIKCSRATSKVLFDLVEGITISSNGTVSFEKIGIIVSLKADDGLYEKMTTKEYLSFFKKISGTNADIGDFCKDLFLVDILNIKLKMLTLAQIKRVLLARALLFNPSLILFEEPTSELDNEGIKLLIACFQYVCEKGVSIITTSPHLEDVAIMGCDLYILDSVSFRKIDSVEGSQEEGTVSNIFKIASKVEDKIILFSPNEIDYVESVDATCQLHISGESFPSQLTMNELEARLASFGFFRCHRSYLVNLQRVRELISFSRNSFALVLDGNKKLKIPLSKTRMGAIKNLLEL